jgi:hypothetical protein
LNPLLGKATTLLPTALLVSYMLGKVFMLKGNILVVWNETMSKYQSYTNTFWAFHGGAMTFVPITDAVLKNWFPTKPGSSTY